MPTILTPALIRQYTEERAVLEVFMCEQLYAVYDTAPVLDEIRKVIAFAFENVVLQLFPRSRDWDKRVVSEALKEGGSLGVFRRHAGGPPTVEAELRVKCLSVLDNRGRWRACDCSDLARFMGSLLEKASTVLANPGNEDSAVPRAEWGDFTATHEQHKPPSHFGNVEWRPGRSRQKDANYGSAVRDHVKFGRDFGLAARMAGPGGRQGFAGISPFKLLSCSTVRKIDVAFGLPEGADISGTTSDSIIMNQLVGHFCRTFEQQLASAATSRLLQLLPLVTMVALGHHALVETALPLTLAGVCTYRIGFYTSLLSRAAGDTRRLDVNGDIVRILEWAETHRSNHHMLCWFDHDLDTYTADLYTSPEEVRDYRSFAATSERFLKYFRDRVHDRVYKADLAGLKAGEANDSARVVI